MSEIKDIHDFIKAVKQKISNHTKKQLIPNSKTTILFRGESADYGSTSCMPNIFRDDSLVKNPSFEKKLFEEMISQQLTSKKEFLHIAIDAQHGGFPSRLLDVTYNSLIALYFALEDNKNDELQNSKCFVYLFFAEQLFPASSKSVLQHYNQIIDLEKPRLSISNFNHKIIDHSKINKRIIAQNGALILFPGNDFFPVQNIKKEVISIPSVYKKTMREDLEVFFGINRGYIYPEVENQVPFVKNKLEKLQILKNTFLHEFEYAILNSKNILEDIIEDILYTLLSNVRQKDAVILEKILAFEKNVLYITETIVKSLTELNIDYIPSKNVFEYNTKNINLNPYENCDQFERENIAKITNDFYEYLNLKYNTLNSVISTASVSSVNMSDFNDIAVKIL